MKYRALEADHELILLRTELEGFIEGMGFFLVELNLFRRSARRTPAQVQVSAVIAAQSHLPMGTDELAKVHRAILPRLELFFEGADISVELSSPGLDRRIKEGAEFRFFQGQGVSCYLTALSRWESGVLSASGSEGIELESGGAARFIPFNEIGKAKLREV
ncbi:MAG: hypothetical protein LBJ31_04900 [Treponema sp.]|jgi:ribosome maturation factor RimP|nr:hypothetical protein [Treponema sp.]